MAERKRGNVRGTTSEREGAEIVAAALGGLAQQVKDLGMAKSTGNPLDPTGASWGAIETLAHEVKGVANAIDHLARAVLIAAGKDPGDAGGG